jgi:hypothetical protein
MLRRIKDARMPAPKTLAEDGSFIEKRAGETSWLRDIHLSDIGTNMSFGPAGSSINAMSIPAPCAAGVTRGLFEAEMPRLFADLLAHDVPQVMLDPARIAPDEADLLAMPGR